MWRSYTNIYILYILYTYYIIYINVCIYVYIYILYKQYILYLYQYPWTICISIILYHATYLETYHNLINIDNHGNDKARLWKGLTCCRGLASAWATYVKVEEKGWWEMETTHLAKPLDLTCTFETGSHFIEIASERNEKYSSSQLA